MNSDEVTRISAWGVAAFATLLIRWGVDSTTSTALATGIMGAAVQLAPLAGGAIFAIWHGWNKRLVHETAIVSGTASSVSSAKALSTEAGK